MKRGHISRVFLLLLLPAALFVWHSSRALPELVAAHFNAAGIAEGFMPRLIYVRFILGIVIVLPSLLVLVPSLAMAADNPTLNLPNRDYWLAPQRRARTLQYLRKVSLRFACTLLLFLCYAHWLVVRANGLHPSVLSSSALIVPLVLFLAVNLLWVIALLRRFARVSA